MSDKSETTKCKEKRIEEIRIKEKLEQKKKFENTHTSLLRPCKKFRGWGLESSAKRGENLAEIQRIRRNWRLNMRHIPRNSRDKGLVRPSVNLITLLIK